MQNLYSYETKKILDTTVQPPKPKIKMAITALVLVSIVSIFFYYAGTRYFDPINGCSIKIRGDVLNGDRSTIKSALIYLKSTKIDDYKLVCSNTKTINEAFCFYSDGKGSHLLKRETQGCYIKNTGITFLIPTKDTSDATIKKRAAALTTYAKLRSIQNQTH